MVVDLVVYFYYMKHFWTPGAAMLSCDTTLSYSSKEGQTLPSIIAKKDDAIKILHESISYT